MEDKPILLDWIGQHGPGVLMMIGAIIYWGKTQGRERILLLAGSMIVVAANVVMGYSWVLGPRFAFGGAYWIWLRAFEFATIGRVVFSIGFLMAVYKIGRKPEVGEQTPEIDKPIEPVDEDDLGPGTA